MNQGRSRWWTGVSAVFEFENTTSLDGSRNRLVVHPNILPSRNRIVGAPEP